MAQQNLSQNLSKPTFGCYEAHERDFVLLQNEAIHHGSMFYELQSVDE